MPTIHLLEGPVGAGKSTYAAKLSAAKAAPRLILDDWMATLFRPDRPKDGVIDWYLERKRRCIEQIWRLTCDLADTGSDVVLELGLIQRQEREDFYARVDATGYDLVIHVLDAPVDLRRQRVQARNRSRGDTYFMEVPGDVFELASRLWQPPDDDECRERNVRFIATGSAASLSDPATG